MTTPQSVPLDLESLIEQRVAVERAQMQRALVFEAERIRWQAEQRVAEAFTVGGQRISTYADSIPPGWGFDYSLTGMPQIVMTEPTVTDTESGADPPKYRTEQDLARYRAMARFVTSVHCPGVGIIENLQNYIIGPGFTYKIRTKMGVRPPDGLVAAVQSFVDRFLDDNDWNGGFDRELLARSATDGEFILDLLGDREAVKSGRPRLEVLEPHFLTECGQWPEVSDRYSFPTSFTFGVHSHATKPFQVLGYSIQGSGAWRYATTSHIVHHKQNVHRNAKRGVSDFFPAWEWLESQSRLLKNTAAGAAELSAIAYILKHAGASESKVQSMLAGKADVTYTGPNGQTFYKQWKPPGSVINAPPGSEYEPGPAGHERGNAFIQVVQGILKQVATRWCMSEGMVSADDSNNNMASSIVAGSRFHRYAVCRQANLSQRFSTIIWKAIQIAYNAGAFSVYGFSPNRAGGEYSKMESLLELKIECPPVDELSKSEQDSIYATRVAAGAMSKSTWRDKVGLDDAVEKENLKKEAAEGQSTQPPAEAPPGMPVAAPEKPVAAKEEMLARPIQEAFCPTGKDGGVDNSCSSRKDGNASVSSGTTESSGTKVLEWAKKKFGDEKKAEAFTSWFGDSKVVDDDGHPLVVYHGTSDEISEFDLDHPNRKDTGWLGTGVYVTTAVDIANSYANLKPGRSYPNVMPLYVKLENPYRAKLADKQRLQIISQSKGDDAGRDAADAWTRQLKAMGHDGVILDFPASLVGKSQASKEIVVFNPSSVKSASGNKGTFNSASPKITESASPTKLSCLMAMLGKEDADAVLKLAESIDASDFAEDGREAEPHCTVKYGFLTQDFQDISPLVKGLPALSLTLGNLSVFTGKEHDVLKLDVESPEIVQLNERVSDALPHVNTHPDYIPHVTVGYLKPGAGKKYAGPCSVTGRNVVVSRLVFSPAEGDKVTIPLEKLEPVMEQTNDVDPSAVIALSTARDAAESLSLRASCRRFVEEHGQEGVRKLFESASKIEAGKSGYCQKMLWQYP